jgi:hypothetical protein
MKNEIIYVICFISGVFGNVSCASNNLSYEGKAFKNAYASIKAEELKKNLMRNCFRRNARQRYWL